jgi:hypothetical protein
MQFPKIFTGLILSIFVMTLTAAADDVSTDYDHKIDFSKYRTYVWLRPANIMDALMRQQAEDAINQQLQIKGMKMVTDPEQADIGLVVNGATQERHTLQTFYDSWPGGWYWGGWGWGDGGFGTATTIEQTYLEGTIVVDVFDTQTQRIVWRGVGTDTLSHKPAKNEKKIDKVVDKMFEHFPAR